MCASCGCVQAGTGTPDDDHGDPRNLTLPELEAAAAAAGITPQQAAGNITETLAASAKTGAAAMIRTAPAVELVRKTISASAACFKLDEGEQGVAEAFVSTTGALDSQGDVIDPGAYSKMIAAWKAGQVDAPARCKDHDWGCVTGFTTDMEELIPGDPRLPAEFREAGWGALWVRYRYILDSDDGRNAYATAKARYQARAGGQHSVGFLVDDDSEAEGKAVEWKGGARHIKRIFPLVEHSDVLLGAAPRTQTARLKSGTDAEDEVAVEGTRAERAALRLERAGAIAAGLKAMTHSHFHLHPDGQAHSHQHVHAGDVTDHDGPGTKVPHAHGHADDGKSAAAGAEKGAPVPDLTGEESVHTDALMAALGAIDALIAQELDEPGCTEYGDVISLAFVAQDLLFWARGEASEYSTSLDGDHDVWDLMAAGREALMNKRTAEEIEVASDPVAPGATVEDAFRLLVHDAVNQARETPPQHHVPDSSGERARLGFADRRGRLRFGG